MRRSLLLLDDDSDLLEALSALFEDLGAECVPVRSVDELVALGDAALACRLAVLDVNLGAEKRTGLDALGWLIEHGYSGRVVFLTGHARSHPLVASALELGVCVLEKPVPLEKLEALLVDENDDGV